MKVVKAVLQLLWKIYLGLVLVISLLVLFPLYVIFLNFDQLLELGFKLTRFHARLILFLSGIWVKIEGSIPRDKEVCYLICPNHTSYIDILMLYAVFPHYFIFLGKQELGKIPLFGLFFKKLNILVDRSNAKAAHCSLMEVRKRLQNGTNVVIFPEGTISHNPPELRPFKNGAFRIAIELELPIVPITFLDNYKILEDSFKFGASSRPGVARVIIHDPIYPENISKDDLVILREQCKASIDSALHKR